MRALYVHCACTVKTHVRPAEAGNIQDFAEAKNNPKSAQNLISMMSWSKTMMI